MRRIGTGASCTIRSAPEQRPGSFLRSGQFPPARPGTREIRLRLIEEKFQRGAARKAIAPAVIRIDPIEGAVRLDPGAGGNSKGIEAVEFTGHRCRRHYGLPYADAVWGVGARSPSPAEREQPGTREQAGTRAALIAHHRCIAALYRGIINCFSSGALLLHGWPDGRPGEYYEKKRGIVPWHHREKLPSRRVCGCAALPYWLPWPGPLPAAFTIRRRLWRLHGASMSLRRGGSPRLHCAMKWRACCRGRRLYGRRANGTEPNCWWWR
jgi:hypothetical protein